VSAPVPTQLFVLQRRLHDLVRSTTPDPLTLEELVCQVVDSATQPVCDAKKTQRRRQPDRAILRALELIHERFREQLTLRDVADHAAYSPFHLTRLFRARTGVPVHRYISSLRLREGFSVLLDGETDLSKVAVSLGFFSHSHFTAAFRQEFGFTPTELRRRGHHAVSTGELGVARK
jgi:AraC-like DNA-binding protein